MIGKTSWMDRSTMLERGANMLLAHWRNRCSRDDLDRWYTRTLSRYAAWCTTPKLTEQACDEYAHRVEDRFWLDAEKLAYSKLGYEI